MYAMKRVGIIDPAALVQKARIVADGGTVVDFWKMNTIISTLRLMGIYGSSKLILDANCVKKNGANLVSKLYDISGNNNDAIQIITNCQPTHTVENGKSILNFDGIDDYLELTNYTLFSNKSNLTLFVRQKINNVGGIPISLGVFGTGAYIRINKNLLQLPTTNNGWYSTGTSVSGTSSTEKISYCFTFDGQYRKAYTNGIYTAISAPTTGPTQTTTSAITIGARDQESTNYVFGEINQIYVFEFTASANQVPLINNLML